MMIRQQTNNNKVKKKMAMGTISSDFHVGERKRRQQKEEGCVGEDCGVETRSVSTVRPLSRSVSASMREPRSNTLTTVPTYASVSIPCTAMMMCVRWWFHALWVPRKNYQSRTMLQDASWNTARDSLRRSQSVVFLTSASRHKNFLWDVTCEEEDVSRRRV